MAAFSRIPGRSRSLDRLLAGASVPYGIKLTGGDVLRSL